MPAARATARSDPGQAYDQFGNAIGTMTPATNGYTDGAWARLYPAIAGHLGERG